MATESNPVEEVPDPTITEEGKAGKVGNELPLKPTVAADFVAADTDRPKADESTDNRPPPGTESAPMPGGKTGRPRSDNPSKEALRSRARYAKVKSARDGVAPPSFSDLPGVTASPATTSSAPSQAPSPGATVNYKANAEACFQLVTGMLVMISGDHWSASSGERDMMTDSLARYMEYKNWRDLSPGWSLTIIVSMYAIPRLTHEKTKEQLTKLVDKFTGEKKGTNAGHDVEVT